MNKGIVFSVLLVIVFVIGSCVSESDNDATQNENSIENKKVDVTEVSQKEPVKDQPSKEQAKIKQTVKEVGIPEGGEIVVGNEVGNDIGEFVSYNPDSVLLKISDYRGKLTMVMLWNSLCGHCVTENQKHAETYKQYHDKQFVNGDGFEIYAIALDKVRPTWIQHLQEMNYPWDGNVYVLDSWKDPDVRYFGIKNLPGNFLIDEDGIVIAKKFTATELKKLLEDNLKK